MKKSISLFGTYEKSQLYSRNLSILHALEFLDYNILEFCPKNTIDCDKTQALSNPRIFISTLSKLLGQWFQLCKYCTVVRKQSLILVPYPSHADILFLRLLLIGKNPTIIMDSFLGLHDTIVEDRQLFKAESIISKLIFYWEKLSLSIVDVVLLDTQLQCRRLIRKYNLPDDKCIPLPVGIDESLWHTTKYPETNNEFRVIFWGTFIPLHGVEIIIDAAAMLMKTAPAINIKIIGTGQTSALVKQRLSHYWPKNVFWIDKLLPIEEIYKEAINAHCVLGIFGKSEKAASVIPYKISQALAMNKPVITRKSDAYAANHQAYSIHTIEPNSAETLANKIIYLAENPKLHIKNILTPRDYYDTYLSQSIINKKLKMLLTRISND